MNKVGCPTCGGLFSNRVKFLDHVRRRNTGKLQFPCKTCGKAFSVERLMRDHMRSHVNLYQVSSKCYFPISLLLNNGLLLFQCPACDMTCSTPSILATHMRYRHTTERPHACQVSLVSTGNQMFTPPVLRVQRKNQSWYAISCKGPLYRGLWKTNKYQKARSNYHAVSNFEQENILNWNQGEHSCQEPGCDFTCRAALTLVRHQVNLFWSTADLYGLIDSEQVSLDTIF